MIRSVLGGLLGGLALFITGFLFWGTPLSALAIRSPMTSADVTRWRTSDRRVFAIGDAAGRAQFTHIAGYHAGIVIRNMLFRLPAVISRHAISALATQR